MSMSGRWNKLCTSLSLPCRGLLEGDDFIDLEDRRVRSSGMYSSLRNCESLSYTAGSTKVDLEQVELGLEETQELKDNIDVENEKGA